MSIITHEVPAGADARAFSMEIPPHLLAPFERADRILHSAYRDSPGPQILIRAWLACASASRIVEEFESAALDIKNRGPRIVREDDILGTKT